MFKKVFLTFAKTLLYFDILICSPTSNLGPFLLFFLLKSIYVLDFTSIGFVLMVYDM